MLNHDGEEPSNVANKDEKQPNQGDKHPNQEHKHQEMNIHSEEAENTGGKDDNTKKTNEITDYVIRKLFVHSQWLSVQSSYFKALFYSGMKETYSKEVAMKIYDHELEAHLVLIEAMYKLDVLKDKDYHLVVQVLVLANKYDIPLVIKKCKYILSATTPSLEMCEYVLKQTEHLTKMDVVYDVLQKCLIEQFSPIDRSWRTEKFTELSEAALRLLLKSDDLATMSENTIFLALMKWVDIHYPFEWDKCKMLDVLRFEFMSVDFLYDVVRENDGAKKMPGFAELFQKGLAYHGFSVMRREQLKQKLKKRATVKRSGPTFSWVIDDKLKEKLAKFPRKDLLSDKFWHQGYQMRLSLSFSEDSSQCSFYLGVIGLKGEACLCVNFVAKSSLFDMRVVKGTEWLYTSDGPCWGYDDLECNQRLQGYTIDVWVELL